MPFEQTMIIGKLNRDPQSVTDPESKSIGTRLNVEVAWDRPDEERGIQVPYRAWFEVHCFGGLHEVAQVLAINTQVMVVGPIVRQSTYTDKSGKPRATMTLRAVRMTVLDGSADSGYDGGNDYSDS